MAEDKWTVTWRTSSHAMLGSGRDQPRQKEFTSYAEAKAWLDHLGTKPSLCRDGKLYKPGETIPTLAPASAPRAGPEFEPGTPPETPPESPPEI